MQFEEWCWIWQEVYITILHVQIPTQRKIENIDANIDDQLTSPQVLARGVHASDARVCYSCKEFRFQ